MTTEHVVAHVNELPEGERLIVKVEGREIGIFKIKGRYYALRNICFHQGGPLCKGAITGAVVANADTNWKRRWVHDGEIIRCPWHWMEFNITTGKSLIYPNRGVRTYKVKVKEDQIILVL